MATRRSAGQALALYESLNVLGQRTFPQEDQRVIGKRLFARCPRLQQLEISFYGHQPANGSDRSVVLPVRKPDRFDILGQSHRQVADRSAVKFFQHQSRFLIIDSDSIEAPDDALFERAIEARDLLIPTAVDTQERHRSMRIAREQRLGESEGKRLRQDPVNMNASDLSVTQEPHE